jgi:TonB family protein
MSSMISIMMAFTPVLGAAGIQGQTTPVTQATPIIVTPSDTPVIPIGPVGVWEFYGRDGDPCAVARNYGTAQKPATVSLRLLLDLRSMNISIVTPAAGNPEINSSGSVVLTPGTRSPVSFSSFDLIDRGQHFDVMVVQRSAFDGLAAAATVTIPGSGATTIPASDMVEAIKVMDGCQAKLFTSWGIDVARFGYGKSIPLPLNGGPGGWFYADSYPAAARRANQEGHVMTVLDVGSDGRAKNCRVMISAGPLLDNPTCELILRRARFAPAHDSAGKPVASWYIVPVRWKITTIMPR